MSSDRRVTIFGAYGHTGRLVVSELRRRGWESILSGREFAKLRAMGEVYPGLEVRTAVVTIRHRLTMRFLVLPLS